MIIMDLLPEYRAWDIKIYASDLSLTAIETAVKGEYEPEKLLGIVDEEQISSFFQVRGDRYAITDAVKELIIFDYHNLKNGNGLRELDVVFCRNVMIYFDYEEQKRLITYFHNSLTRGGYLFIGHAESLQGMDADFRFIHHNNGSAYRKMEKGTV